MILKFNDGTEKACMNPVEVKLFKNGVACGWSLSVRMKGKMTSSDIDRILGNDLSTLIFCSDEGKELFTLLGYERANAATVRLSENEENFITEIQLMKGVMENAEA